MLGGYPKTSRLRGFLDGYPVRRNPLGQLSGMPDISRRLDLVHPINRGLVGWWPLDEGQGTQARDLSIYQNHGAIIGMANPATATSGWGAGPSQRQLAFDGSNDYISVPTSPSLAIVGDISMVFWLKYSAWNWHMLFTKTNGGTPGPYSAYVNAPRGTIEFHRGNGTLDAYVESTTPGPLNNWYCTAVTMTGTAVQHYLNGETNGSGTLSTTIGDSGNPMRMGSRADGFWLGGQASGWRLYNRALTATEIKQIYADKWIGAL